MSESRLENHLKRQRKSAGLSQNALAERVGVSRQAILAVEAGRNVPSTSLGLKLAYALGCNVEDIFQLAPAPGIEAHLAPAPPANEGGTRVALGRVADRWVAHRLPSHGVGAADGTIAGTDGDTVKVTPLVSSSSLQRNVLVAGCAPLLGGVAARVGQRFSDARVTCGGPPPLRRGWRCDGSGGEESSSRSAAVGRQPDALAHGVGHASRQPGGARCRGRPYAAGSPPCPSRRGLRCSLTRLPGDGRRLRQPGRTPRLGSP